MTQEKQACRTNKHRSRIKKRDSRKRPRLAVKGMAGPKLQLTGPLVLKEVTHWSPVCDTFCIFFYVSKH